MSAAKYIIGSLVFAAGYIALAFGLRYAESAGVIGHDVVQRVMQVVFGLCFAVWANFMPKDIGPLESSPRLVALRQSVLRVGGWAFLIGGLGYAAAWAFAPMSMVTFIAIPVMLAAMAVAVGHMVWAVARCGSRTPASDAG